MTLDDVRQAVERHACHVQGIRYGFALKWAAVEQDADPDEARYLLNVEFVATPGNAPAHGLQLLVRIGELSELGVLLEDALFHYIADQLVVGGGAASTTPRELGRGVFPSAAVRSN
jgi:hypothetical protein